MRTFYIISVIFAREPFADFTQRGIIMPKNAVAKIMEGAVIEAFQFHLEASAPPATAISIQVHDAEKKFIETLSPSQLEAYQSLTSGMAEQEIENSEHYYRLGFIDGLSAWRGA